MDARLYLRGLMESLADSFNETGHPDLSAIRSQLQGAAQALVATEDLPADAVHDVLAEFDDVLEDRGMTRRIHRRMSSSGSVGVARDEDASRSSRAQHLAVPGGESRLQAVLPINELVGEFDGFVVTAISLELWSAFLSFRYAMHGGDVRTLLSERGIRKFQWEGVDDQGGVYHLRGEGAGGRGTGGLAGEVTFDGPIAANARQFVVRLRHRDHGPMSVLVDLPSRQQ